MKLNKNNEIRKSEIVKTINKKEIQMKANSKQQFLMINKIIERAYKLELVASDRFTLYMDLEVADDIFNLRLDDLLNSDNGNFAHDVCGIQNHIDRGTKTILDCFVPRFSSGKN